MSQFQVVNPADVKDGYHIPSGRSVHKYKGQSVISNTGYGWNPQTGRKQAGTIAPQPYSSENVKPQYTQQSNVPLRDPFGAREASARGPLAPKDGTYRNGQREVYKNGKWQPVNIIQTGQRAQKDGKWVTADGQGNWYDPNDPGKYSHETGKFERKSYGTYSRENRTPVKASAPPVQTPPVQTPPVIKEDKKPVPERPPVETPPVETPPVETPPPEQTTSLVRPETTTTNANGVEQTGVQMTSSTLGDFNDMYARVVGKHNMSATAYNPFESVHLHTQGDSREDMVNKGPSSYSPDEAAAFNSGQGIEWSSDQKANAPYTIPKPADVTSTEGAPQIVKSGATKVVKGVNGHEFGGDHEAPATRQQDRTSRLREKWMLGDMKDEKGNDLNTMQRLRGMRREQGFDRQGTKFYAMGSLDPANKSKPTEISQDQYRQAVVSDAGARQVATDLKDAYTSKIKADNNPERSDTQFEPDTSGLNPQVSEAVGMTQAPASFNADGPKDERSSKFAQDYLKVKKPFAG